MKKKRFDVIVIGAGSGLEISSGAAAKGLKAPPPICRLRPETIHDNLAEIDDLLRGTISSPRDLGIHGSLPPRAKSPRPRQLTDRRRSHARLWHDRVFRETRWASQALPPSSLAPSNALPHPPRAPPFCSEPPFGRRPRTSR